MANLSRLVRYHALRSPQRIALIQQAVHVSYAGLWSAIGAVAGVLRSHGIVAGSRVALFMKNSIAFIEIAFAVSHIGAVLVPLNFRLAADEVDDILQDSGAALLFCDHELTTWNPDRSGDFDKLKPYSHSVLAHLRIPLTAAEGGIGAIAAKPASSRPRGEG